MLSNESEFLLKNIQNVRSRISEAANRVGRNAEDILLVVVTKTIPSERIAHVVNLGEVNLGENRVQEMMKKQQEIPGNISWHLIGQLQKNKVKYTIDGVSLIHSLCDVGVAHEINRLCEKKDSHMDVLIEVNVSKEETKAGVAMEEVDAFIKAISGFDRVSVKGLMTVAPYAENPEEVRGYFAELRHLFGVLSDKKSANFEMKYLSMGMSNDFEVAVEEGANIVRIGSSIFGDREVVK